MPSTQATSSQDHSAPLPTVPLRPAEPLGPPPWLRELSLRFLVWGKKERSDPDELLYIVHADDFHNPEGNMGLAKSHCGLPDVMMEGVYENPLFMVKAMRLIQALRSHMEDPHGSANVEIGVCCSRGRDRSVALEFMLKSILEVYRCNVLPTKYLEYDAGNWSHLCFSCHNCR